MCWMLMYSISNSTESCLFSQITCSTVFIKNRTILFWSFPSITRKIYEMLYPTLSTIQESMSNIGHSMNLFSNFLNIFIVCALFHSSLHSFGFLRTKPELEPQCRWTTIGGNLEFFLLIEFEKKIERVEWLLRRKCIKKIRVPLPEWSLCCQ